ncbi:MAG TPA: efflux RND transporter periplasmic adaptor subunit [Terriglobia bacterium]|jgi:HlyD family secretion protein|nr:efflux RND transporter periplasmic adaptor subunit [Terriglobia bacterium]
MPSLLHTSPRPIAAPAAVAVLGALSLWGCSGKDAAAPAPTMTVQVAAVQRDTIAREVTSDATLYPFRQAAIVPKISAPVSKFYVERGDRVRAGQLLAELESRDLAAAVTENQGAYQQAEATYQTAMRSGLPEEMQKAQLDLDAAHKGLDAQQKIFDNRQSLYQQGAIPRKDLDDAGLALAQARGQYEIAQKHLDSLRSFGNADGQQAAQGELQAAKGRYEAAQAQLAYAQVRSPIDGVVTDRPVYPGEMAAAGSPLITVMDLSRIVARAHIAQQEAAFLRVGDEATLAVGGVGDEIPAKVTLVSPALDPNSTTVEVWAEAANPHGRLRPGTSARVTFVAGKVKDALVIPAAALVTAGDGSTSVILAGADGKPQQKPVKTGIRQGDRLQITEGLREGDRVVTQGAFEIAQEDPDVLARTRLLIVAPKSSDEGGDQGPGKDADPDQK